MRIAWIGSLVMLLLWPGVLLGQTRPSIALTTDVEDGKKMLHATVTLAGKPLENVTLDYFVQRTFGNLQVGEDTTLDDGTSAVAFPTDLPGAVDGNLHATVRVKSPDKYANASVTAVFAADVPHAAAVNDFPRALWAPQAPLALMAAIFGVVGCVWVCYLFVVLQVLTIRKVGKP